MSMHKTVKPAIAVARILVGMVGGLTGVFCGAFENNSSPDISPGVAVRQDGLDDRNAELDRIITAAPKRTMKRSGLAAVTGGVHLKVTSASPQQVILPIPQLADGQVPICYFIRCVPADAADEFRLRKREDCNVVASISLVGGDREVRLAWSAVVLLAPQAVTANTTSPEPYRAATPCVQSEAAEIAKLATDLWPETGSASEFAANIQRHIRETKRKDQPRSLDALGILSSGENSICTANANLAAALMRAKGIACRSLAVVPPNSQRLEMHRIVEFFDNNQWQSFDPSSLGKDIPAKSWQNIVMAKTTARDEETAMKPRAGSMVGCPYGQEVELLSSGVNLLGQDFFWSKAKPLAEFEPTDEAIRLAVKGWKRYLETGSLGQGQLKAASAKSAEELAEDLQLR